MTLGPHQCSNQICFQFLNLVVVEISRTLDTDPDGMDEVKEDLRSMSKSIEDQGLPPFTTLIFLLNFQV
jgi:hypothetical protein